MKIGSWRTNLDAAAAVAMIAAAGYLMMSGFRASPSTAAAPARGAGSNRAQEIVPPAEPFPLDNVRTKGSPTAPLVMIAFSDFECPYCRRFAQQVLPELEKQYITTGKLQFGFYHLPLEGLHKNAVNAALATECAHNQGKFWAIHDGLFKDPMRLDRAAADAAAVSAGLDAKAFGDCMNADNTARIRGYASAAVKMGIQTTPTLFVGSRTPNGRVRVTDVVRGSRPANTFTQLIDRLLARQAGTQAPGESNQPK